MLWPYSTTGRHRYCRLLPAGARPDRDAWNEYVQVTKRLADAMCDDFRPLCNCKPDVRIPAGFTYLGQLVDHDLTHDLSQLDDLWDTPCEQVVNAATPFLDLSVLYGHGPNSTASSELYDGPCLKVGQPVASIGNPQEDGSFDVALDADQRPLTADERTPQNVIQRQLTAAFARLHNAAVDQFEKDIDDPDELFEAARLQTTWQYQWLVYRDLLARVLDPQIYTEVFLQGRPQFSWKSFSIPIEFAAAAYRFGHSMVREQYLLSSNKETTLYEMMTQSIQPGPLTAEWRIDWSRFFQGAGAGAAVTAMPIDTRIAKTLHNVPGRTVDQYNIGTFGRNSAGAIDLPHTSLKRGALLQLPCGQETARELGIPVLTRTELTCNCREEITDQGRILRQSKLAESTPLWYYLLKEAEVRANGNRLGPSASRIVAETVYAALLWDGNSFINHRNAGIQPPIWTFGGKPRQFHSAAALFGAIGGSVRVPRGEPPIAP